MTDTYAALTFKTSVTHVFFLMCGFSIYEGTISNWVKQPGDRIEVDELVVVVATEKTSIDVRSPTAGQLLEHIAKADQVLCASRYNFNIDSRIVLGRFGW